MKRIDPIIPCITLIIIIFLLFLYKIFYDVTNPNLKQEAISLHYASFNTTNGQWHWNSTNSQLLNSQIFKTSSIKEQAVLLNFAQFNPTNGNWQWIYNK